jgi:hypothetical protein
MYGNAPVSDHHHSHSCIACLFLCVSVLIGDEDTVTGFLLAGIGEVDQQKHSNFLVVTGSKQLRAHSETKMRTTHVYTTKMCTTHTSTHMSSVCA